MSEQEWEMSEHIGNTNGKIGVLFKVGQFDNSVDLFMVVFHCFSKTGLCIYFSLIFPEYCARICATKLSDFTFTHN